MWPHCQSHVPDRLVSGGATRSPEGPGGSVDVVVHRLRLAARCPTSSSKLSAARSAVTHPGTCCPVGHHVSQKQSVKEKKKLALSPPLSHPWWSFKKKNFSCRQSWFQTQAVIKPTTALSFRIRKAKLPVKVCSSAVQLHMRGKPKSVTVESRADLSKADFKKSRDGFVLLVPAHWRVSRLSRRLSDVRKLKENFPLGTVTQTHRFVCLCLFVFFVFFKAAAKSSFGVFFYFFVFFADAESF